MLFLKMVVIRFMDTIEICTKAGALDMPRISACFAPGYFAEKQDGSQK